MKSIELKHSLLTESALNTLKLSCITTVESFLNTEDTNLSNITSLSPTDIKIIKNYFQTIYSNFLPITLSDYEKHLHQNLSQQLTVKTGIATIDEKIGEIPFGTIIELSGDSTSGKTMFCTTLFVNFIVNYNLECYWIDTKNDLSAIFSERVMRERCQGSELINNLKKITVLREYSLQEIITTLEYLIENVERGFLVIDSLTSVLCEYLEDNYKEREENLNKIFDYLRILCTKKKFIVVVTILPIIKDTNTRKRKHCELVPSNSPTMNDDFSSLSFIIRRTETDPIKLENLTLRNSNERVLHVTKCVTNTSVVGTKFDVKLTQEGVL